MVVRSVVGIDDVSSFVTYNARRNARLKSSASCGKLTGFGFCLRGMAKPKPCKGLVIAVDMAGGKSRKGASACCH